jgi:hypothetical protein
MKLFTRVGSAVALTAASVGAFAQSTPTGPDLSSLTSSVSGTSTITAVLAVSAVVATIYLAIRGARIVLSMIRG